MSVIIRIFCFRSDGKLVEVAVRFPNETHRPMPTGYSTIGYFDLEFQQAEFMLGGYYHQKAQWLELFRAVTTTPDSTSSAPGYPLHKLLEAAILGGSRKESTSRLLERQMSSGVWPLALKMAVDGFHKRDLHHGHPTYIDDLVGRLASWGRTL